MLKHPIKTLSAGVVLVIASSGVWAQTSSNAEKLPPATPLVDSKDATKAAAPHANRAPAKRTTDSAKKPGAAVADKTRSGKPSTGDGNPSEPSNSGTTTGTVNNTTTPSMAMGISGTMPGSDATSGDATNMRNNPGSKAKAKNLDKNDKDDKIKP